MTRRLDRPSTETASRASLATAPSRRQRRFDAASRAGSLAVLFGVAAVVAVAGLATDSAALTWIGLACAVAAAALFAAYLIVTERRRHEAAEEELTSEALFLESLVESMGSIAGAKDVLAETCVQAERLFEARARMLRPGERPRRAPAENAIVIPLKARDEEISALRLTRDGPFDRDDVVRATVLADFAAREYENSRLLAEAQVREVERSRLTDQLITAEQDERRRLANELHDSAVQSLSGIALLLDAGLNSIAHGRDEEAREIIGRALERHRATIGQLRDLSFHLEPVVLRDQGFAPAVRALMDQLAIEHGISIDLDADAGEQLAEKTQAALYQIIREALNQAVRRGPPEMLSVRVRQTEDGGVETCIADNAPGERRRRSLDELVERARTLNGDLTFEPGENGGTTVRVVLPPYAVAG
jgi:signal transduction histidine kinase